MGLQALVLFLRHVRPFGLSSLEFGLTIFVGFIIQRYMFWTKVGHTERFVVEPKTFWIWYTILAFVVAIFIHASFGVNTQLNWWLGIAKCPPNPDSLTGIFDC
jgi:hypothetical protein